MTKEKLIKDLEEAQRSLRYLQVEFTRNQRGLDDLIKIVNTRKYAKSRYATKETLDNVTKVLQALSKDLMYFSISLRELSLDYDYNLFEAHDMTAEMRSALENQRDL